MAAIHRAVVAVRYAVASRAWTRRTRPRQPSSEEDARGRPAVQRARVGLGGTYARPGQQSLAVPRVTADIRG